MGHQNVRAGLGHEDRIFGGKYVGRRQQIHRPREPDHFHLARVAHVRFLEVGAKCSVNETDRGKILHAREAGLL